MKVGVVGVCAATSRRVGSKSLTAALLASFLVGAAPTEEIFESENYVVVL